MAHGFGKRSPEPYMQLVREIFPKVSYNLQNIIAVVPHDAEPIEEPKPNRRDELMSYFRVPVRMKLMFLLKEKARFLN
jgi:hypothetical protein